MRRLYTLEGDIGSDARGAGKEALGMRDEKGMAAKGVGQRRMNIWMDR